jgi:glycosyltransferase involved in cell wall biosynthesis
LALLVTTLGTGGTERYVEDLAIGLKTMGILPLVIADCEPTVRGAILERWGIPVKVLGAGPQCGRRAYSRLLAAALSESRVRLVHVNAWLRFQTIVETVRSLGLPIVCTRHCTDARPGWRDYLGLNPRRPFNLWRERVRARRDRVPMICISQTGLERLRIRWPEFSPATVVYNGVRAGAARSEHAPPPGEPLIVWAGSFVPRKRPFLALETFRRVLRTACPAARLRMLGDGPLRSRVSAAAARVSDRIELPGQVSGVMDHLSEGSIFLQTSANEGISYALLEALSAGLPAVATAAGATCEAVLDGLNGFLAPVDHVEGLASGCSRLLRDERLRRSFGEQATAHIASRFSLDRMVVQTLEAYQRFCGVAFEPPRGVREAAISSPGEAISHPGEESRRSSPALA